MEEIFERNQTRSTLKRLAGPSPCPSNAETLSRVHLQDRFVHAAPGFTTLSRTPKKARPGKALSIAVAFGHFDTQKQHDLNVIAISHAVNTRRGRSVFT
ncbi:MAG: hypothetical protein E5V29_25390 [Mesorhizobium sp.]|nr:MAG: hypothetical protein E5V29_25390 [Mesorhizobium sp.]